jgi:general secretion pathway protein D
MMMPLFRSRPTCVATLAALLATLLAACATAPTPTMRRDATLSSSQQADAPGEGDVTRQPLAAPDADPRPIIRRGTGQAINRAAASAPPPNLGGTTGQVTFNFEGEALHAVVKAILGDMLGQNYVIAPGVQGTVTYVTARPVNASEALSLLEMILGWNNARMVYADGRYSIVPADAPLAGSVAPRTGPASNARGFESRVVPLRYISALEMKKVLEPYARPNAIVNADAGRNVITLAGTRAELENYLRTIEIFDVDWMSSMSVGVFPLQSGRASRVAADLEKVFGEQSKSPVAGMFRFMPLEGANAVLVITQQPDYLDDIQEWLERIDGAGGGVSLYSYELKYITARDLAERLAEVYGSARRGGGGDAGGGASLMPGLEPTTIQDSGIDGKGDSSASIGGDSGGDFGGTGSGMSTGGAGQVGSGGSLSLGQREGGNASVSFEVDGSQVGVSAVEETNSILVRSTGQAWRSIKQVIEKLDVMPLQVHIEAQVAEVNLNGDLSYGVNWYLEQGATNNGLPDLTGPEIPSKWSTLGASIIGSGANAGLGWTLIRNDAAAIITALDDVSDVRLLQSPSVMVRNNEEATFTVGSRIPIASVTVNPIQGDNTFSQVQYLDTGIILKVRPRATKDGTVFFDIVQEVSSPGSVPDQNGNVRIDNRRMKTTAIGQSGNTTILAGLISDDVRRGATGFPGLSRIPVIGGLFGRQTNSKTRSEVIVLLTPTIVRDPREANDLTDEYGRRFRAMEPLRRQPGRD